MVIFDVRAAASSTGSIPCKPPTPSPAVSSWAPARRLAGASPATRSLALLPPWALLAYAVLRLTMEFFRADSRGSLWFGTLTSGQGISILLLIAGGAMWYLLSTREKIEPEPSEEQ